MKNRKKLAQFEEEVAQNGSARKTKHKKIKIKNGCLKCNILKLFKLGKLFKFMKRGVSMGTSTNTFDRDKFKQVLHYIISKTGNFENVGKTVLFKMLYFSDFDYYEINENSITGEVYAKLPQGPAPRHFDEIISELESEKKVKRIKKDAGGYKENLIKFVSLVEPAIDKLNINEKGQIDLVLRRLSSMSATQVSGYSHGDLPWKATEEKKDIDYEFVFYRDDTYSVRDKTKELTA